MDRDPPFNDAFMDEFTAGGGGFMDVLQASFFFCSLPFGDSFRVLLLVPPPGGDSLGLKTDPKDL